MLAVTTNATARFARGERTAIYAPGDVTNGSDLHGRPESTAIPTCYVLPTPIL
jgi:hypothetical protein